MSIPISCETIGKLVRTVPDFPKPGILFYDITTLLKDKTGFAQLIDAFAAYYIGKDDRPRPRSIEARGFIFGPALAYRLNLPALRPSAHSPSCRCARELHASARRSRVTVTPTPSKSSSMPSSPASASSS